MVPRVGTPPPTFAPDFYVSPTGSSSNNGSIGSPWSLTYALAGAGGVITAGKQIALRGGTYSGFFTTSLAGTASQPIIFRQMPGERAVLDGNGTTEHGLTINGSDTWWWGFEMKNSNPPQGGGVGINCFAPRCKLINLTIHDMSGTGIGFWIPATDSETHGCIVYYCGSAANLDHGIYTQNSSGIKRITDNVVFSNYAFGLHGFTSSTSLIGYVLDGNVCFLSAAIAGGQKPNIFLGGSTPADDITVTNNVAYSSDENAGNFWFGYDLTTINQQLVCTGNYVTGGFPAVRLWNWTTATVSNNFAYAPSEALFTYGAVGSWAWTNQSYGNAAASAAWLHNSTSYNFAGWKVASGLGSTDTTGSGSPTGSRVLTRANSYEQGRGHVAIHNWDLASSVAVNLSTILTVGQLYDIYNIENLTTPILSGTYGGGSINFPMSAVSPPAPIVGTRTTVLTPSATGPTFQVFLVRLQGS